MKDERSVFPVNIPVRSALRLTPQIFAPRINPTTAQHEREIPRQNARAPHDAHVVCAPVKFLLLEFDGFKMNAHARESLAVNDGSERARDSVFRRTVVALVCPSSG